MINNLDDGKSVQLGEFGTFRPSIKANASNTEEEADASKIYRRKIVFTPGSALKSAMNNTSITRYAVPDTDYTDGTGGSGTGNDDDDFDPSA